MGKSTLQNAMSETVHKQPPKQFKNGVSPLGDYLIHGGPGRPKGSKSKSTRLRDALASVKADISVLPLDVQHACMDYISKEEWLNTLRTARKEETKVALIREWWDRRLPKIPVSVSMESHSSQITGTLVDLLSLLRSSNETKQLPVENQGVIEVKALPDPGTQDGT
jgi:hypothetical protein